MNILPWIVVFVCTSLYIVQSESEAGAAIPIEVGRRHMKDFYVPLNSEFNTNCDSVNNTYLVSQRTCVKNEELFSSKYFKSQFVQFNYLKYSYDMFHSHSHSV